MLAANARKSSIAMRISLKSEALSNEIPEFYVHFMTLANRKGWALSGLSYVRSPVFAWLHMYIHTLVYLWFFIDP